MGENARDKEHQHEEAKAETWLDVALWRMEAVKRRHYFVAENGYDAKEYLSVYVPGLSSMQLHTFMLGSDVARPALLLTSRPPFRAWGAWEACAKDDNGDTACTAGMIPYAQCLVNSAQGTEWSSMGKVRHQPRDMRERCMDCTRFLTLQTRCYNPGLP